MSGHQNVRNASMMSPTDSAENEGSSLGRHIIRDIKTKKSAFWGQIRKQRMLALFHSAARRVPAYHDFLKKNKIAPAKIKTLKDFESVPWVSKENYLQQYPLEKLMWDGTLRKPLVWTATSGSTGTPFYFPRGERLDWQSSIIHELFLRESSYGKTPTLVIVGFGMGVWIGGLITYKAFEIAALRNHFPISLITPGINKEEVFNALKNIAPKFHQTILVGYPPFLKDIVDEAKGRGVDLRKLHIRLLFAAEAFTEKFRDYMVAKAGVGNAYLDTMNIYGTADIGSMASETPTAILMRRLFMKNKNLFSGIFGSIEKTPTLAQYNPYFMNFEAPGGNVLLTGDSSIPFIRYAIGDHGGIFSFTDLEKKIKAEGCNLKKEARRVGIGSLNELPLVYVYERSDLSTKLYGAIIYPEPVREALIHSRLGKFFTGKFTMITQSNRHLNQFLELNLELRPNVRPPQSLTNQVRTVVIKNLLAKNSEYRNNYSLIPEKVTPHVFLYPNEHPLHFKPGGKQKWVKHIT